MFMNTIAVGPLEDVISCVTGGTTVAIDRDCVFGFLWGACRELTALALAMEEDEACLQRWDIDFRNAMMCRCRRNLGLAIPHKLE